MTISKADERWLACLDRALVVAGTFRDAADYVEIANAFYAALPTVSPDRPLPEQTP